MDSNRNLLYDNYDEYLDSLVDDKDIQFLQDRELARFLVELGYRQNNALTRQGYADKKMQLEMTAKINEASEASEYLIGVSESDSVLMKAVKERYKANKDGHMNTILYLYTIREDGTCISGHVDLAYRISRKSFLHILTQSKPLVPCQTDLTCYHWGLGQVWYNSSSNWEVTVEETEVKLKHRSVSYFRDYTSLLYIFKVWEGSRSHSRS